MGLSGRGTRIPYLIPRRRDTRDRTVRTQTAPRRSQTEHVEWSGAVSHFTFHLRQSSQAYICRLERVTSSQGCRTIWRWPGVSSPVVFDISLALRSPYTKGSIVQIE